jgi:hypothetical protein
MISAGVFSARRAGSFGKMLHHLRAQAEAGHTGVFVAAHESLLGPGRVKIAWEAQLGA